MIKFIGIDLDGTLLDSDKRISDENLKAIEEAERRSINVTIFTGRSFIASKEYFEAFSSDIPGVFQNGAFIATLKSHKILKKTTLSHKVAKRIIELSKENGLFPIVFTNFMDSPDMIYEMKWPERSNYIPYLERNAYRMIHSPDMINCVGEEISEVSVIGAFSKIKNVEDKLDPSDHTFILSTRFSSNDEAFVEIFGPGCGKEKALKYLLDRLSISRSEAAFIGDNYNDLEALKSVGHPIVMGNADTPDELIRTAEFVTFSNDNNGVAKAIMKYII
jgi:Cof subfamily protein (haloacid dehalogenase superfamily)